MDIHNISFSNTVYLKKYIEYNNSMVHSARILDRIEHTKGFDYHKTTIYIEPFINNRYMQANRRLFKNYYDFTGRFSSISAAHNPTIYFDNFNLDLKFNILNLEVIQNLEKKYPGIAAKISAMPPFPHKDCIKIFGDIMIVRLSNKEYKVK